MTLKEFHCAIKYKREESNVIRLIGLISKIGELCRFLVHPNENVRDFAHLCMKKLTIEE